MTGLWGGFEHWTTLCLYMVVLIINHILEHCIQQYDIYLYACNRLFIIYMNIKFEVSNRLDAYLPFTFGQKTAKAPKCTTSNISTTNSLEFSITIHLNGIVPSFTYKTTKTRRWWNLIIYLDHANTWSNIDKKIGKHIIRINLNKFLLPFHMGKSFISDSLTRHKRTKIILALRNYVCHSD